MKEESNVRQIKYSKELLLKSTTFIKIRHCRTVHLWCKSDLKDHSSLTEAQILNLGLSAARITRTSSTPPPVLFL